VKRTLAKRTRTENRAAKISRIKEDTAKNIAVPESRPAFIKEGTKSRRLQSRSTKITRTQNLAATKISQTRIPRTKNHANAVHFNEASSSVTTFSKDLKLLQKQEVKAENQH
jgi:hypothetical protein